VDLIQISMGVVETHGTDPRQRQPLSRDNA
jgi:hypothetical protein